MPPEELQEFLARRDLRLSDDASMCSGVALVLV